MYGVNKGLRGHSIRRGDPSEVGNTLQVVPDVLNALDNGIPVGLLAEVRRDRDESVELLGDDHAASGRCSGSEVLRDSHRSYRRKSARALSQSNLHHFLDWVGILSVFPSTRACHWSCLSIPSVPLRVSQKIGPRVGADWVKMPVRISAEWQWGSDTLSLSSNY